MWGYDDNTCICFLHQTSTLPLRYIPNVRRFCMRKTRKDKLDPLTRVDLTKSVVYSMFIFCLIGWQF